MGEGKQGFVHSLQKNRSTSEKYLISSSITSRNGNNMFVPKFWLTAQIKMGDNTAAPSHKANFTPLLQRDASFKICAARFAYPYRRKKPLFYFILFYFSLPLLSFFGIREVGSSERGTSRCPPCWWLWSPPCCQSHAPCEDNSSSTCKDAGAVCWHMHTCACGT